LLLKENPVLPNAFNFKGHCLLQQLKMELRMLGFSEKSDDERESKSPTKRDPQADVQTTDSKQLAADPFDVDDL
jgi:hypothetical protein